MLYQNADERYGKLKREFRALMRNFNRDDLDDFIATAHSLRNWVRQDVNLNQEQKQHLEHFVSCGGLDWQICEQLANQVKHVKPDRTRPQIIKSLHRTPGAAGFRELSSMRVFGAGENISLEIDGHTESAFAVVIRIFQHFRYIFEVLILPPHERSAAAALEKVLSG